MDRRLSAIVAVDVVGYSALMSRDEAAALAAVRRLRKERLEPLTAARGGRIVKLMGDGALIEFGSVVEAVRCAIDLQTGLAEDPSGLRLRAGIDLGDVVHEDGDVYGDGVNVAARLEALSEPGGLCLSGAVRDSVAGRIDAPFEDAGARTLKNIERPVSVWRWRPEGAAAGGSPDAPKSTRLRLLVLPFDSFAADPSFARMADGFAEDLTTELARLPAVEVVARTAAFALRGQGKSALAAAAETGASHVVEGSLRAAGPRLRLNAQLIDARSGAHLWAERFDGEAGDPFALHDAALEAVAAAVEIALSDGEQVRLWRAEARSPAAYAHFIAGRGAYAEYSRHGNARARAEYQAALAITPDYPSALAGLARTHIEDACYGWSADRGESLARARHLLDRVLEAQPDHALALAERSHERIIARDLPAALAFGRKAVAADPRFADAQHVLATVYNALGEHDDALRYARKARTLSPAPPEFYLITEGDALAGLGRWDEVERTVETILAARRDWLTALALKALARDALGDPQGAEEAVARMQALNARFTVARWRAAHMNPDLPRVEVFADRLRAAGLPD